MKEKRGSEASINISLVAVVEKKKSHDCGKVSRAVQWTRKQKQEEYRAAHQSPGSYGNEEGAARPRARRLIIIRTKYFVIVNYDQGSLTRGFLIHCDRIKRAGPLPEPLAPAFV